MAERRGARMPVLGAKPLDGLRGKLAGRRKLLPAPLTKRSSESVDLTNRRRRHQTHRSKEPVTGLCRVCAESHNASLEPAGSCRAAKLELRLAPPYA